MASAFVDDLDGVAIGIEDIGGVVAGIVFGAGARRDVVSGFSGDGGFVDADANWASIFIGDDMASITGFGGVFLRANDPKALYEWYERHLGLVKSEGAFAFPVPTQHPQVIFSLFKQDNAYFPPAQKAMLNLQVDDLDGLLDRLIADGVTVDPDRQSYDFGKFGWVTDPEGNRVELWQPIKE